MKSPKKKWLMAAAAAALLIIAVAGYSCAAKSALEKEIAEAVRDPRTGIILGTEPLTLPGEGGKACLLVHGWVGSRIDFNDLGERLRRKGATVRLMLLPGHGTTPRDLNDAGVDDFLAALGRELDELEAAHEEVTLIGFSLGGALATLTAARAPPDRLVLAAPFFEVTYRIYYVLSPETWNSLLSPFIEYVVKGESFIRVNREEARSRIFSYKVIPTRAVTVLCEAGRRARDPEVLGKVTCPLLLLHSRGDMAASFKAAEEAFGLMRSDKKEIRLFDRSNHHLFWDYDCDEVMEEIVKFVMED